METNELNPTADQTSVGVLEVNLDLLEAGAAPPHVIHRLVAIAMDTGL